MKYKNVVAVICVCIVIGVFGLGMVVGAATAEPGSAGDPLITKSYLDSRLEGIGSGGGGGNATTSYKKVKLLKGERLIGGEGTEIVLISGTANSFAGDLGIINLTVGEKVANGMSLGKYATYLTVDNASGVQAAAETIVFVRGSHTVKR